MFEKVKKLLVPVVVVFACIFAVKTFLPNVAQRIKL